MLEFGISIDSRRLAPVHPYAPGRRTFYASVKLGRHTFFVQRWSDMKSAGRMVWSAGRF